MEKNALLISSSKRRKMIYIVIFLWFLMGILGLSFNVDLGDLAAYFLSMSGFVGVYIWSEYKRKSTAPTTTLFPRSDRERLIYGVILIWLVTGLWGILHKESLMQISAYFGVLTAFIGPYIITKTYRPTQNQDQISLEEVNEDQGHELEESYEEPEILD